MLLKSCLNCTYHEITEECKEQTSRCLRENCYSRHSQCVAQKALNNFLKDESFREDRPSVSCSSRYYFFSKGGDEEEVTDYVPRVFVKRTQRINS